MGKLFLFLSCLNFYNYDIASINEQVKLVNIFYDKPVLNNKIDKTLIDNNLAKPLCVYYPFEKTNEKYPLVIFVHGWGNDQRAVASMARFISYSGFVTVVISVKKKNYPEDWLPALESALNIIENYSVKKNSLLHEKIDFKKIALVGHSMGGTGVLHYANRNKKIVAVIAMHPYNGGNGIVSAVGGENQILGENLNEQNSYTLILTGNKDTIALPDKTYEFFQNLNFASSFPTTSFPRGIFLMFDDVKHNYPVENIANIFENKKNEHSYDVYQLLVTYYLLSVLKNKKEFSDVFLPTSSTFKNLKQILGNYKNIPAYNFKW